MPRCAPIDAGYAPSVTEKLKDWQAETLLFAPLWVYAAVAGASGMADPSQFRRFWELLEIADPGVDASSAGHAALATLRANPEASFGAFQALGDDPRKGLQRTSSVLKRLPDTEREAIARWLVEVGIRVAEASRVLGEQPISDLEVQAIRDIAKWLGAPEPDLGPR